MCELERAQSCCRLFIMQAYIIRGLQIILLKVGKFPVRAPLLRVSRGGAEPESQLS